MKKILLTMLGLTLIATTASAQMDGIGVTVDKVDVAKLKSNVAKSNDEIADAKKAAKAATWLKRGDIMLDVDAKPVNGLYASMPEAMLKATFGDAAPVQETVNGNTFTVYTYEHFKVYIVNGMVDLYVPTTVIEPDALDKAYDAFDKAYQLDAKTAKKVGEGMLSVKLRSFENGGSQYALGNYIAASENFRRAYRASSHPASGQIDTLALYYAGMSAANGADYANSLKDLDKAIELGYEADGDVYRLKFIDLYNLDRKEESLEALKVGLSRFPTSEDLVDMMMRYYAENDGDPSALIPMAQEAISKSPSNASLYLGLARIYDKLGQVDNAIEAAEKAVELAPEDFYANYFKGLYIVNKGDIAFSDLGKQNITSAAQSQTAREAIFDIYRQAVAPLEKAFALNSKESAVVGLLKNLTFRLREDPGVEEKYKKYDALYSSMEQE